MRRLLHLAVAAGSVIAVSCGGGDDGTERYLAALEDASVRQLFASDDLAVGYLGSYCFDWITDHEIGNDGGPYWEAAGLEGPEDAAELNAVVNSWCSHNVVNEAIRHRYVPTTEPPLHERRCPGSQRLARYHATGTGSYGMVTYATPSGTSQGDASMPLSTRDGERGVWMCVAPGEFLYISVQTPIENGFVSCSIEVDGVEVAENSSRGSHVIATCNATA